MMHKNTKQASGKRNGSITNPMTKEIFDNYPKIIHTSTIKTLLNDMLNPVESKRASAK